MSMLVLAVALVAGQPVKDPFWPIGYEGERHVISAELRAERRSAKEGRDLRGESAGGGISADDLDELTSIRVSGSQWQPLNTARQQRNLEAVGLWDEARETLRFGGVIQSRGADGSSSRMAVLVNGRAKSEGDLIRVDYEGYRFVWRVAKSDNERMLKLVRVKAFRHDVSKGEE